MYPNKNAFLWFKFPGGEIESALERVLVDFKGMLKTKNWGHKTKCMLSFIALRKVLLSQRFEKIFCPPPPENYLTPYY